MKWIQRQTYTNSKRIDRNKGKLTTYWNIQVVRVVGCETHVNLFVYFFVSPKEPLMFFLNGPSSFLLPTTLTCWDWALPITGTQPGQHHDTTRTAPRHDQDSTGALPGQHRGTTRTAPAHYQDSTTTLPGQHRRTTRTAPGHYQDSTGALPGQHRGTTRTALGHYQDSTGTLPGQHRDTTRTAPGHYQDSTTTLPG